LSYWEITNHKTVRIIAGELPYTYIFKVKLIFVHVSFYVFVWKCSLAPQFTPMNGIIWNALTAREWSLNCIIFWASNCFETDQNHPFWPKLTQYFMKGCASKKKELKQSLCLTSIDLIFFGTRFKLLPIMFRCMMVSLAFWYEMVGLIEDKIILIVKNNIIHTNKGWYK